MTLDTHPHAAAVLTRPVATYLALSSRVVLVTMPAPRPLSMPGLQAVSPQGPVPPPLVLNQLPPEAGGIVMLLCRPDAALAPGQTLALRQEAQPDIEFELAETPALPQLLAGLTPVAALGLALQVVRSALGTLRARGDTELIEKHYITLRMMAMQDTIKSHVRDQVKAEIAKTMARSPDFLNAKDLLKRKASK